MTTENDLVLIYMKNSPLVFARIEEILPDSKRGWFHVKFLMLQIPPQVVTWILRDAYINGEEFTMNGDKMRIDRVEYNETQQQPDKNEQKGPSSDKPKNATVISFPDAKKK